MLTPDDIRRLGMLFTTNPDGVIELLNSIDRQSNQTTLRKALPQTTNPTTEIVVPRALPGKETREEVSAYNVSFIFLYTLRGVMKPSRTVVNTLSQMAPLNDMLCVHDIQCTMRSLISERLPELKTYDKQNQDQVLRMLHISPLTYTTFLSIFSQLVG